MIPLLAALSAPSAYAGEVMRDTSASGYHLAQAKQFMKNKWYDDAAREVEAALSAGGDGDFEVNLLGAQVYYELIRMDRASALAHRAVELAPNSNARDRVQGLADSIDENWGQLTITAPYPDMASRLQIDVDTPPIDPDQKRLLNKLTLQLHENTALPVTVSLPVGDYRVNGVKVSIPAHGEAKVALDMKQLGARGLAALQVARFEVSPGLQVFPGARLENGRIAGNLELAFTQPLGWVLLGVVADWTPRGYTTLSSQSTVDPLGLAGGLRVGHEFTLSGPLALRPAVGLRYGTLPGIALDCTWDDPLVHSAATCTAPGEGASPTLAAYADGRALAPFAEVSAEYRRGGRTTALGVGVKAGVEYDIGSVAPAGTLEVHETAGMSTATYTVVNTAWSTLGVRLSATLDFAF